MVKKCFILLLPFLLLGCSALTEMKASLDQKSGTSSLSSSSGDSIPSTASKCDLEILPIYQEQYYKPIFMNNCLHCHGVKSSTSRPFSSSNITVSFADFASRSQDGFLSKLKSSHTGGAQLDAQKTLEDSSLRSAWNSAYEKYTLCKSTLDQGGSLTIGKNMEGPADIVLKGKVTGLALDPALDPMYGVKENGYVLYGAPVTFKTINWNTKKDLIKSDRISESNLADIDIRADVDPVILVDNGKNYISGYLIYNLRYIAKSGNLAVNGFIFRLNPKNFIANGIGDGKGSITATTLKRVALNMDKKNETQIVDEKTRVFLALDNPPGQLPIPDVSDLISVEIYSSDSQ